MNMHGIVRPEPLADEVQTQRQSRVRELVHVYRWFLLLVVFPTVIVAAYFYLVASNQYESRADFVVRHAESSMPASEGISQLLGFSFGSSATTPEGHLVADYLLSHDAVARLRQEDQLVDRFSRPGTDWLSRLWFANPTPEMLLKYYKKQVKIREDTDTGISELRVHAFTPEDAYAINRKLLALGEERINQINERTYHDQVSNAARELDEANNALSVAQEQLTTFRKGHEDIDPAGTGKAQVELVANLTASLVAARARLHAMDGVIGPSTPQYRAASAQARALEAQVAGQSNRIAGTGPSIASTLGDYENLVIRRENAARRYSTVSAEYDSARAEAARKQLYLIRVVEPNLPVKSLFPERGTIVLTVFFGLVLAYGIGWLLLAGVKEHSI